jgi:hypothetical protein
MRIRRGIIAAGITVASFGFPFATAGPASAVTPTEPSVAGVITGPHTFILDSNEIVVLGEILRPDTPAYTADVPVTGISTVNSVTTVTTGATFLPLNRPNKQTTFTVVLALPPAGARWRRRSAGPRTIPGQAARGGTRRARG